jgi:N-acetyl-gamma-glutamyl-phosphate reductase
MQVGVFGASGYAGREAVRILGRHPEARVAFATGSREGGLPHEEGLARGADAYLLALPHGISGGYAAKIRAAQPDAVVIDLSGDLRIPTAEGYERWYGHPHPAPALLGAPYGLSEVFAERIRNARVIANPGCYATSVLLPLLPLLVDGRVDAGDVVVDAKEVADDFSAYAPGRAHRHIGEMEAVVAQVTGKSIAMTFCPHLLPVKRGILSAIYLKSTAPAATLAGVLREYYTGAPFVRVTSAPPRLSDVTGTNACWMSVHDAAPGRVVVFSALDNLVKGAAGQAVQNLNLASGLPETMGLEAA